MDLFNTVPPTYVKIADKMTTENNNLECYGITVCPTRYRTRHFFNNSNTNEDIATKFEQGYVRCVRIEEECVCSVCLSCTYLLRGSVASGTLHRCFNS
jgi:hypothetical protein